MNSTKTSGRGVSSPVRIDGSIFDLQNCFGVRLNRKEARLDMAPGSGLAQVKTVDGSDRAVFNWSVATRVMKQQKGEFFTRGNQPDRAATTERTIL